MMFPRFAPGRRPRRRRKPAVLVNRTEDHEVGAGALRADLGHLERPEAAREGELRLVGHVLAAKDKDRMLLKRRACPLVCGVIRRDIGKRHTAQLGGEARTERDNLHGEPPLLLCLPDFPPKSASWQGSPASGDRAKMKF